MRKILAILLALVMTAGLCACGGKGDGEFKVGVILIGDENEGYTEAHMDGIEEARVKLGLREDQIIYKYNVPEGAECYDAAEDLAEQGCKIIFANSFGHETYMIQAAEKYPDIYFCHATGQNAAKQTNIPNIYNYFTAIYESRYISGIVAGMKLKELMDSGAVSDPYVGYVGAFNYAEVVSGYTAFFLGVRSIVPEAHMDVTYTGEWFDLNAEAEAANSLMARGCVIIGQHADSTGAPSAVQEQWEAGKQVYSVGYNIDMLNAAPDAALTSAQNEWGVYYTFAIETAMKNGKMPKDWGKGYSEGAVTISKLGKSCAPGTAEAVNAAVEKLKSGELHVFDTSTFTVDGKHLDSYDKSFGFEGTQLIWDGYFHESEVISAPLFDIRIDGITELNGK